MFRARLDYELYLMMLRDASVRCDVAINGYTLMTTHAHLMATPCGPPRIARMMQILGDRYVYYFNHRYGRTGGLFDGRYGGFAVDTEAYWFTCMRYVEANPVRAHMVARPEAYPWSSYRYHAFGRRDVVVTPHPAYMALGKTAAERQRAWRAISETPLHEDDVETVRESITKGCSPAPMESKRSQNLQP